MRRIPRKTVLTGGAAVLLVAGGVGAATAAGPGPDETGDPSLTAIDLQRASEAAVAAAGGGRVTAAEVDDGAYEVEVTLDDGTEVDVQLDRDFTVVGTWRDEPDARDEPEEPIPGSADLARAAEAALAAAGGGRVTDTDVEDGPIPYEVEVTLDDGTEVDVQLDHDVTVVGTWRDEPDARDEPEEPVLSSADLARAAEAALAAAGGGRVTDTDVEDGPIPYEIEVTLDDGTEVDVQLDRHFTVVGTWREGPDGDRDDD